MFPKANRPNTEYKMYMPTVSIFTFVSSFIHSFIHSFNNILMHLNMVKISGRSEKKVVGDDIEAPKAPILRRRVLHGGPQPQWAEISLPPLPR